VGVGCLDPAPYRHHLREEPRPLHTSFVVPAELGEK
jgi:hypothetical protein